MTALVTYGSARYWETVDLRRRILRTPLGQDIHPADLEREGDDLHLALFQGDKIVACLVLSRHPRGFKMRQVAVDDAVQGRGLGTALVAASEAVARQHGAAEMVLSARETAIPFYTRLGYAVEGEPYEEITIPHRFMAKAL